MSDNNLGAATPLLTVVTVCLDRVGTIAAAIESVQRQQASDVDHLIIDGVSTDGTLDVIARYPSVRVISERDTGLYDAMDKGVRLARGRYVLFLNSDDELADGVVEAVRPYMQAGYDAICAGTDFLRPRPDGQRDVIGTIVEPEAIVLSVANATLGSPLLNAKVLRRQFLVDAVGHFDLEYRLASDVDLLLRAAIASPRVAVVPLVGHHYMEHAGSLTINPTGNNGRKAAEECLAIANTTLAKPKLAKPIRRLMRAWRGGKILALSNLDRRERGAGPSWLAGVLKSPDVAHFGSYLLQRRRRSLQQRFASGLASLSQSRQDVWLLQHVFNGRRDGRFVEIGAYDGVSYSNCALMEGAYGWRGICIEPNPSEFAKLQQNRSARALNVAVGRKAGTMRFRIAGMLSGLVASYEDAHKDRIEREFGGDAPGNIVDVPVRDLASILKESGFDHIDYISIDVEGGERDIIESLAASNVPVTALTIENNYASRDLRRQVEALGMIKVHELEADDVFVRRGVLSPAKVLWLQSSYMFRPKRIAMRFVAPFVRSILPAGLASIARAAWRRLLVRPS